MRNPVQAVFFDADGVLVDSLPQHLQICRDLSKEFGLGLRIPAPKDFRDLVRAGRQVSPMRCFFTTVGFPEELLDRATARYEKEFASRYRPAAFPGVSRMLQTLREAGLHLGLVTSNTRANVVSALGDAIGYFDERLLFFHDRYPASSGKAELLAAGARLVGAEPDACVYIGDQPADAAAAEKAGMRFLGVTYGWGLSRQNGQDAYANAIAEIPGKLKELLAER